MMDKFRNIAKGPVAAVLLGLVIISFAVTGIESYLRSGGSDYVAKVNGEKITQNEWERAFELERNRLGENYSRLVDTDDKVKAFRKNVLDRLILERLGKQASAEMGLRVGKQQLNETIWAMPVFQLNGKFNAEQYENILRSNGMNSQSFQDSMRDDMTNRQLMQGLVETAFVLPGEALATYQMDAQERGIRYLQIAVAPFADKVQVSDADLKTYYDAHPEMFREPEQVNLEYIQLSTEQMAGALQPSDDELKKFYEEKSANYKLGEQRRIAHILINADSDAKPEDVKKAEAKIADIEKRLKAGEDFAALAKQFSDDSASAENGGDLDWLVPGTFDPAVEKAADELKEKGQISGVVRSAFGFHLIRLLDIKSAGVLPYEQVKERVLTDYRKAKQDEMATEFFNSRKILEDKSFEFSDSLAEAEKALNVKAKETGFITREGGSGIAADPKVLAAAFSPEVLQEHRNSDVIELGDQNVVVVRVKDHKPETRKAFDVVKADIAKALKDEKGREQAKSTADGLFADIKAGKDVTEKLKALAIDWKNETLQRTSADVDPKIREDAYHMSLSEAGKWMQATLANGDQAIVELLSVKDGDAARFVNPEKQQLTDGLARFYGQGDYSEYIEALKAQGKIVYSPTALAGSSDNP